MAKNDSDYGQLLDPSTLRSSMPVQIERMSADGDPTKGETIGTVFLPTAQRTANVITDVGNDELAKAIAAGKTCESCRYYDHAEGQRRFQRERLGTAVARELAWKPEWFNVADYGACGLARRDAVHKHATCEMWVSRGRLVSFVGKLGGK